MNYIDQLLPLLAFFLAVFAFFRWVVRDMNKPER